MPFWKNFKKGQNSGCYKDKPTKGWACVVRRSTVNDLDQKLGPTTKRECGQELKPGCATRS